MLVVGGEFLAMKGSETWLGVSVGNGIEARGGKVSGGTDRWPSWTRLLVSIRTGVKVRGRRILGGTERYGA